MKMIQVNETKKEIFLDSHYYMKKCLISPLNFGFFTFNFVNYVSLTIYSTIYYFFLECKSFQPQNEFKRIGITKQIKVRKSIHMVIIKSVKIASGSNTI